MPSVIHGESRLVIGTLLFDWENWDHCLFAYVTRGYGDKAVVASLPDHEGRFFDIWSIAERHLPHNHSVEDTGRWCMGAGWNLVNHRERSFQTTVEPFRVNVRNTLHAIKRHEHGTTAYGWNGAFVGMMEPLSDEVMSKAHSLSRLVAEIPRPGVKQPA